MSTVSGYPGPEPSFDGPDAGWLIGVFIALTVVTLVGLVAIYIGVQYGEPSWAAHPYPPPILP